MCLTLPLPITTLKRSSLIISFLCSTILLHSQRVIFVNDDANGTNTGLSWTDAFNDLQDALAETDYGDQIWVASGVYNPIDCLVCNNSQRKTSFKLANGVKLYGGFNGTETLLAERSIDSSSLFVHNPTLLSGDIGVRGNALDNSYSVVFASEVDENTTISGFIITGGNANSLDSTFLGDIGGGGLYSRFSNLIIEQCLFQNNSASVAGGAVVLAFGNSIVRNCEFVSNSSDLSGGGLLNYGGSPLISSSTFTRNASSSGRGSGGGIYNLEGSPIISNCYFNSNIASIYGGGISGAESNAQITNCYFFDNISLGFGGGIGNSDSSSLVSGCTFSNNWSNLGGGGIYAINHELELTDCLIEGNNKLSNNPIKDTASIDTALVSGGGLSIHNASKKPPSVDHQHWENLAGYRILIHT
ncbi:MAG: hypothetical protein AAF655_23240 [Bacteroidota bacterium]